MFTTINSAISLTLATQAHQMFLILFLGINIWKYQIIFFRNVIKYIGNVIYLTYIFLFCIIF